jgi:FKBP-type peptidyl-prolyl cis-trans isomerase
MKRRGATAASASKVAKVGLTKKAAKQQPKSIDIDSDDTDVEPIDSSFNKELLDQLKKQVSSMAADLKKQQEVINDLTTRMTFVVSWLESGVTPEQCSAAFNDFAAAVKRPAAAVYDRAAQESIVAAVYVDSQRRSNRATNFIVSGLPVSDVRPDQQSVVDLCRREFNETPDVVHTKRLGKVITGRVQPLLVVVKTVAQAARFIASAKKLRQSTDSLTKQNVYISANLTKAEARAAYDMRCQRRQAAESRKNQQQRVAAEAAAAMSGSHLQRQQQKPATQRSSAPSSSTASSSSSFIQSSAPSCALTGVQQLHNSTPQYPVYGGAQSASCQQPWQKQQQSPAIHQQHWLPLQPQMLHGVATGTPLLPSDQQLWQQSQLQSQSQLDVASSSQSLLHRTAMYSDVSGGQNLPQQQITPLQYGGTGGFVPPSHHLLNPLCADFQAVPTYSSLQLPAPTSSASCDGQS